jgi:DNA-binding transcriptional ArsR family regulator
VGPRLGARGSPGLTSASRTSGEGPPAVWAALADPPRRRLLDQLSQHGPLTATELAPDYPVSRQAVVKHLAALSVAGLVTTERQGRDVRYRVVGAGLDEAAAWLSEVGAVWDVRLAALRERFGDR